MTKDTYSLRNVESLSAITLFQRSNEGMAKSRRDEVVVIFLEKLCDVLRPHGCSIFDSTTSGRYMDTSLVVAHEQMRHTIPNLFATAGSRYIQDLPRLLIYGIPQRLNMGKLEAPVCGNGSGVAEPCLGKLGSFLQMLSGGPQMPMIAAAKTLNSGLAVHSTCVAAGESSLRRLDAQLQ
eukprot:CAMPEP_0172760624 /NCGR_PEP_ID=MMETSP1074-20121228/169948_1 /TAXON_ID=2916 /ORGANISM="Ceratium fusus, Strain PA161109" /LENGTH=178 /DNA_ID=CAMNT_0013594647 /DNA_START=167 /DNA_END=704 /DNA_ORIENTATION=+